MAAIANILLPIFAIVAFGAVLRRVRFVPEAFFRDSNRLVYWVAIPAYLFYKSAEATIEGDAAIRVGLTIMGGMVVSIAVGLVVAHLLRLPPATRSSFAQGAFRGNLVYVGLPVVLLAMTAREGVLSPATEAIAVLSLASVLPAYNFTAVLVLISGQAPEDRKTGARFREFLLRIITNPLLVSCLAGLLVMALGWKLPTPLRNTLAALGDLSTPLALLGIGASLTVQNLRSVWKWATAAAVIKLVISPAAGLAVALPLHLTPTQLQMALLYLACPTATASYVMAQQLGCDEQLAANIIVLTTFLSLPALALVLALTR